MTAAALPPGATIGIVGGGQLGRMSAMAAARLGYRTHILGETADCPAAQVAGQATVGSHADPAVLDRFAQSVDVVTFEFENVSAAGLEVLAARRPVRPAPHVLRISQDRLQEKAFLNAAGVATAPWQAVTDRAGLATAAAAIGLPGILKTTRLGYDGRGQRRLDEADDLDAAWAGLAPHPLVLEGLVDFACEISVVVARGLDGQAVAFDTVENRHRDHILDLTLAPARIPEATAEAARQIALRIAERLDLVGVLAVEMFVDRHGEVLVNEIAPRPHNSGHWTLDACPHSQFDLHIRAVAGLALPQPVRHSDAVMKNLIGPQGAAAWPLAVAEASLIAHHYGKDAARPGRKLGHVTHLFPRGALPGELGIADALGALATPAA